ncbi:hypothetical protein T03_15070 [Trichinella britovi]|uniref:Uncharacterized protein n=1 Tax=Trichinella britovi TaxID=45882 RepID=A0A0V0Z5G7_TRIBR|nr:hypothetical protein T03_15070 [Trichinella britovi]
MLARSLLIVTRTPTAVLVQFDTKTSSTLAL